MLRGNQTVPELHLVSIILSSMRVACITEADHALNDRHNYLAIHRVFTVY